MHLGDVSIFTQFTDGYRVEYDCVAVYEVIADSHEAPGSIWAFSRDEDGRFHVCPCGGHDLCRDRLAGQPIGIRIHGFR